LKIKEQETRLTLQEHDDDDDDDEPSQFTNCTSCITSNHRIITDYERQKVLPKELAIRLNFCMWCEKIRVLAGAVVATSLKVAGSIPYGVIGIFH